MSKRNPATLGVWGFDGVRVTGTPSYWQQPLKWNRQAEKAGERQRVFCASLADIFEDWRGPILDPQQRRVAVSHDQLVGVSTSGPLPAPLRWATMDDLRRDLFALIDNTPWLDWQVLTKRPQNVRQMWQRASGDFAPRSNVWLGTSVSDQRTWDCNSHLLYHNCRDLVPVLFVSAEPLLGRVKVGHAGIDNVIIGVESNGTRAGSLGEFSSEADWIDGVAEIVQCCDVHNVAAFVKQVPIRGRVSHDPDEWPEQLRVRRMPTQQCSSHQAAV